MRVVIGGCGRVGSLLAQKLAADGYLVAVIDKDPDAFRRLGPTFRGDSVRGMVFDKQTMETETAGIEEADAFIAVTSGDNSNVVSASVAKDIYRVPRVVARIFDPRRAQIYRRLGIQTVSSVSWAANEIMSLVRYQSFVRDLTLGDGEVRLLKTSIPPRLVGRTVADLTVPGEVLPVAIVRGGSSFIPTSLAALHEGDILEMAVASNALQRLEALVAP